MELDLEHWDKAQYQAYCGYLLSLADEGYREFCQKGVTSGRPLLGVRIPLQRRLAREIARGNVREFLKFTPVALEEVNLRGLVIASLPYAQMCRHFPSQLPYIDDWSTCDTFCNSLKSVRAEREDFLERHLWPLLEPGESREFYARVGLVCLLCHYVQPEYLQVIFEAVERVNDPRKRREGDGLGGSSGADKQGGDARAGLSDGDAKGSAKARGGGDSAPDAETPYYVRMATAWLLTECFTKYPETTLPYLQHNHLSAWTRKKTISKICDSYRVSEEEKELVKRVMGE